MPPGTGRHEAIITFLVVRFFLEKQRLGLPLEPRTNGVEVLTNKQARRPDVLMITPQQVAAIENTSAILKTPLPLIVEVVSPESIDRDYRIKTLEYADFGVAEYWIVDPLTEQVTVGFLQGKTYNQTVFTGNQQIISLTFPEMNANAENILGAKL